MGFEIKASCWKPMAVTLLMGASLLSASAPAAPNLSFRGALVAQACTLRPGDDDIPLQLWDTSSQYLYLNTRTIGKPFEIHLEGCDISIGNDVTITFSGNASAVLPGLLALGGGSTAAGVAIGIETPAGNLLPLNVTSDRQALTSGANVIALKSFIEAEPQAIANQSVTAGLLTATSTFTLNYP